MDGTRWILPFPGVERDIAEAPLATLAATAGSRWHLAELRDPS